jgi:hypothetical protein
MIQTVWRGPDLGIRTTSSPIRIDGERPGCTTAAPLVGAQSQAIRAEFGLDR